MTKIASATDSGRSGSADDDEVSLADLLIVVKARWRGFVGVLLLAGLAGFGVSFLVTPTFTAKTVFLPPQQQQGGVSAALSSLGGVAGMVGAAAGIKSSVDQYIAFIRSDLIGNRIVDQHKLMAVYESKFRVDALKVLAEKVRVRGGAKDGLITIEVDDESPERSAAIANGYVDALRSLTNNLAVTEAQQRRVFFDQQLRTAKAKLTQAQVALQTAGFNAGALKVEPKAAAENYARTKAEITSGEVRLQAMRGVFADSAPEIVQQQGTLMALRRQLASLEGVAPKDGGVDYISSYREFKYQEALFDMFVRQYELARIDESREGALIQVLDVASVPERKSGPRRSLFVLVSAIVAGVLYFVVVISRGRLD
jgi:uncharacterized protein involved in exopolysaccharide biosynthesis